MTLTEKEGSVAAAGRLKTREEEKICLEATLRRLWARLERGRVTVFEDVFADAVYRLRVNLRDGSTLERRRVLKSFVQKIEVGGQRGTLYYTFPLNVRAYVLVPPARFERAHTAPEAAALSTELRGRRDSLPQPLPLAQEQQREAQPKKARLPL